MDVTGTQKNKKMKGKKEKMKKQAIMKSTKTVIAILAVLLVLVAAMCTTVMASDSPVTPSIVSKNASFDDNIHIYFAVPAEGIELSNITLRVYDDANGENELQTPRTPALNEENGTYLHSVNGTSCYIFRTIGIAPKNADKMIYVQAVNTVNGEEYKSEIEAYNIVTYLNEMLYKKGFITANEGKALVQRNLYLETLDYCSRAQELFVNYKDNDASNDLPLFNEYNYVYIEDGTVDGKEYGFYLDDEEATLVANITGNKVWEITKYAGGKATVSTLALGEKLIVDAPMTLKLVDDATAAMKGTIRFDSADDLTNNSLVVNSTGTVWENGRVKMTTDGTNTVAERFRIKPTGTNTGMDTLVFEADITIDNTNADTKPNGILYFAPYNRDASNANAFVAGGKLPNLNMNSSSNKADMYCVGGAYTGSAQTGESLSFKVRYTYQYVAATADATAYANITLERIGADGTTLQSVSVTSTTQVWTPDECLAFEMNANSAMSGVIYIDNVSFYQTGNALNAE